MELIDSSKNRHVNGNIDIIIDYDNKNSTINKNNTKINNAEKQALHLLIEFYFIIDKPMTTNSIYSKEVLAELSKLKTFDYVDKIFLILINSIISNESLIYNKRSSLVQFNNIDKLGKLSSTSSNKRNSVNNNINSTNPNTNKTLKKNFKFDFYDFIDCIMNCNYFEPNNNNINGDEKQNLKSNPNKTNSINNNKVENGIANGDSELNELYINNTYKENLQTYKQFYNRFLLEMNIKDQREVFILLLLSFIGVLIKDERIAFNDAKSDNNANIKNEIIGIQKNHFLFKLIRLFVIAITNSTNKSIYNNVYKSLLIFFDFLFKSSLDPKFYNNKSNFPSPNHNEIDDLIVKKSIVKGKGVSSIVYLTLYNNIREYVTKITLKYPLETNEKRISWIKQEAENTEFYTSSIQTILHVTNDLTAVSLLQSYSPYGDLEENFNQIRTGKLYVKNCYFKYFFESLNQKNLLTTNNKVLFFNVSELLLVWVVHNALNAIKTLLKFRRLHLDLKPSNLLISEQFSVVLTDCQLQETIPANEKSVIQVRQGTMPFQGRFRKPENKVTSDKRYLNNDLHLLGNTLLKLSLGFPPASQSNNPLDYQREVCECLRACRITNVSNHTDKQNIVNGCIDNKLSYSKNNSSRFSKENSSKVRSNSNGKSQEDDIKYENENEEIKVNGIIKADLLNKCQLNTNNKNSFKSLNDIDNNNLSNSNDTKKEYEQFINNYSKNYIDLIKNLTDPRFLSSANYDDIDNNYKQWLNCNYKIVEKYLKYYDSLEVSLKPSEYNENKFDRKKMIIELEKQKYLNPIKDVNVIKDAKLKNKISRLNIFRNFSL